VERSRRWVYGRGRGRLKGSRRIVVGAAGLGKADLNRQTDILFNNSRGLTGAIYMS